MCAVADKNIQTALEASTSEGDYSGIESEWKFNEEISHPTEDQPP